MKKMKKRISLFAILFAALAVNAQPNDRPAPLLDRSFYYDALHISSVLLVIILIAYTVLAIIKVILDHRIKNKLVERGAPESIVTQLLQPVNRDSRNTTIKWICIFAGVGLGLSLIDFFQPLGIHSIAIMSFCLAAGFLAYFFLTRNAEK